MCGEKLISSLVRLLVLGSPPHVRGKANETEEKREKMRITPACAGKSRRMRHPKSVCRDHPRMCGEKHFATLS